MGDEGRYGNNRLGRNCAGAFPIALYRLALMFATHPGRLHQAWKDTK